MLPNTRRLCFTTSYLLLAICLFALTAPAYSHVTKVVYEVRRSTVNELAASTLVGITASTAFVDTNPSVHNTSYYYFVRAVGGTEKDIKIFGGNIAAKVFFPRTSSDEVADLVFYTQNTTFSGTFFLLDNDQPDPAELIWPENEDLLSEQIQLPIGQQPRLTIRLTLLERLWTADEDETVELIAYDPFSESVISALGTTSRASAVAWTAGLAASNTAAGVSFTWDAFTDVSRNSLINSIDILRDIPTPLPPQEISSFSEGRPFEIELQWSDEVTAATYSVYRSTTADFQSATVKKSAITGNSFIDTTVTPGATYYYWVTSSNDNGESAASAAIVATAEPEAYALFASAPFGSVSLSPDKARYAIGDEVTLTAAADVGYAFKTWGGDATPSESSTTSITISGNTFALAEYSLDMPQSYMDWLATLYPNDTNLYRIGPDRDHDGDGLGNFLEFVLATDEPETADNLIDFQPPGSSAEGGLDFSVSAYPSKMRGELTLESSSNLEDWSQAEVRYEAGQWKIEGATAFDIMLDATEANDTPGYWTLHLTASGSNGQPTFVRLSSPVPSD